MDESFTGMPFLGSKKRLNPITNNAPIWIKSDDNLYTNNNFFSRYYLPIWNFLYLKKGLVDSWYYNTTNLISIVYKNVIDNLPANSKFLIKTKWESDFECTCTEEKWNKFLKLSQTNLAQYLLNIDKFNIYTTQIKQIRQRYFRSMSKM